MSRYNIVTTTWAKAWVEVQKLGYPIYVTIDNLGTHKLYPSGYTRPKLPNEAIPEGETQ